MARTGLVALCMALCGVLLAGCGDGEPSVGTPTASVGTTRTVAAASPAPATAAPGTAPATAAAGTSAPPPVTPGPSVDLSALAPLGVLPDEAPFGFRVRSNQPVTKNEVVAAQVAIEKVARYADDSDLVGAWGRLFTREQPSTGLSSIVYRFGSPQSAAGFVDTFSSLTQADYPTSLSVEQLPAERVGDRSQLTRYRIPGARALEYTFAQGPLVSQIIFRYAGDIESPDDIMTLLALARMQQPRMVLP